MQRILKCWGIEIALCLACTALACGRSSRPDESTNTPDRAATGEHASGLVGPARAQADAPRAVPLPSVPSVPSGPPPVALEKAPPVGSSVEEALRYDPADPLSNLEAADVLDRGASRKTPARQIVVPARGCAVADEPRRVWSKPGIASVAAFGGGYVLAGYTRTGASEQVFVVHVTERGKLEPVATLPLSVPHPRERVAAPGLAASLGHGVTVAYIDGAGELYAQTLRVGDAHGGGAAKQLAKGVDTRFTPAVQYSKRGPLIAYTLGTTPMRSFLVRIDPKGDVIGTHDVTPISMGAAAPAFIDGGIPATLLTADPRSGMSPIARSRLDDEGKPTPAEVLVPVSMMSQPPQLSAAQSATGAYVLFSGFGSAATSAVGLVRVAPTVTAPEAFIKGTSYGVLSHAAVSLPSAVVIAATAPLTPGKQPKHDVQFALLDAKGQGPQLHVALASGDVTHVSLASGVQDQVGFAVSAPDGVYLGALRCSGE